MAAKTQIEWQLLEAKAQPMSMSKVLLMPCPDVLLDTLSGHDRPERGPYRQRALSHSSNCLLHWSITRRPDSQLKHGHIYTCA